ncbi:hypothetical protein D3C72_339400 [compost metagenome]
MAPAVGLSLLSLVLIPLSGWAVAGLVPAAIWAGVCLVAGLAAGARARSRCGLMSGLAAMIMHLAWSAGFLSRTVALAINPGPAPRP